MNTRDIGNRQFGNGGEVALRDQFEALANAENLVAPIDRFDGSGADYAVNARGRPASDNNCNVLFFHRIGLQ